MGSHSRSPDWDPLLCIRQQGVGEDQGGAELKLACLAPGFQTFPATLAVRSSEHPSAVSKHRSQLA